MTKKNASDITLGFTIPAKYIPALESRHGTLSEQELSEIAMYLLTHSQPTPTPWETGAKISVLRNILEEKIDEQENADELLVTVAQLRTERTAWFLKTLGAHFRKDILRLQEATAGQEVSRYALLEADEEASALLKFFKEVIAERPFVTKSFWE